MKRHLEFPRQKSLAVPEVLHPFYHRLELSMLDRIQVGLIGSSVINWSRLTIHAPVLQTCNARCQKMIFFSEGADWFIVSHHRAQCVWHIVYITIYKCHFLKTRSQSNKTGTSLCSFVQSLIRIKSVQADSAVNLLWPLFQLLSVTNGSG